MWCLHDFLETSWKAAVKPKDTLSTQSSGQDNIIASKNQGKNKILLIF